MSDGCARAACAAGRCTGPAPGWLPTLLCCTFWRTLRQPWRGWPAGTPPPPGRASIPRSVLSTAARWWLRCARRQGWEAFWRSRRGLLTSGKVQAALGLGGRCGRNGVGASHSIGGQGGRPGRVLINYLAAGPSSFLQLTAWHTWHTTSRIGIRRAYGVALAQECRKCTEL
jgi:hypothetical protein